MSALRLYLDEDSMSESLVRGLQARGVDVRTALDDHMVGRPDEEQLRWATRQGRTLVSFNVGDYYRLHTAFISNGERHAGIVLAQQRRYAIGQFLQALLRLASARSSEDMADEVIFLSAWMSRYDEG